MKANLSYYPEKKNTKEINIREFFLVLKKRFWIIVLVTILSTATGYFYSVYNNSPLYQTSTRIVIGSDSDYMKTLMVMIKDPIVMEMVKEKLQLSRSAESIANQVEVMRIDDSQIIKISVIDKDPKLAVKIANTTAQSYKSEVDNILEFDDVQLLSGAKESHLPINGNKSRIVILTIIFGLITGTGLTFLLDSLDDKVNKEHELEEVLGVPVLGIISNMNKKRYTVSKKINIKLRGETLSVK